VAATAIANRPVTPMKRKESRCQGSVSGLGIGAMRGCGGELERDRLVFFEFGWKRDFRGRRDRG